MSYYDSFRLTERNTLLFLGREEMKVGDLVGRKYFKLPYRLLEYMRNKKPFGKVQPGEVLDVGVVIVIDKETSKYRERFMNGFREGDENVVIKINWFGSKQNELFYLSEGKVRNLFGYIKQY